MKKILIKFCVVYTLVSVLFLGYFIYSYYKSTGAVAACDG